MKIEPIISYNRFQKPKSIETIKDKDAHIRYQSPAFKAVGTPIAFKPLPFDKLISLSQKVSEYSAEYLEYFSKRDYKPESIESIIKNKFLMKTLSDIKDGLSNSAQLSLLTYLCQIMHKKDPYKVSTTQYPNNNSFLYIPSSNEQNIDTNTIDGISLLYDVGVREDMALVMKNLCGSNNLKTDIIEKYIQLVKTSKNNSQRVLNGLSNVIKEIRCGSVINEKEYNYILSQCESDPDVLELLCHPGIKIYPNYLFDTYRMLIKNGISKEDAVVIMAEDVYSKSLKGDNFDVYINKLIKEKNINPKISYELIKLLSPRSNGNNYLYLRNDKNVIDTLLAFRERALKEKQRLMILGEVPTDDDVDNLLFSNVKQLLNTLDVVGEDNLIYNFKNKKGDVKDFLKNMGSTGNVISISDYYINMYLINFESLKELINPTKSQRYRYLNKNIRLEKQKYINTNDIEEKSVIKRNIANLTTELRTLMQNSIKDHETAINTANIYYNLLSGGYNKDKLLTWINPKNDEERKTFSSELNKLVYDVQGIARPSEETLAKLDFSNCMYLPKLLKKTTNFSKNFKNLVDILETNKEKSALEIFNELPQNLKTKELFEEYKLNYDKWVNYDKNSYVEMQLDENTTIKIRKADMNNIPHALFLGNDSSCCTGIGNINGGYAPNYIINKFISAVEILENDKPIGNTMCYFAEVDGRLSLILDNIELKNSYSSNYQIYRGIYKYARQLTSEMGKAGIPIYANVAREDINMSNCVKESHNIRILGESGTEGVYIDFYTSATNVKNSTVYRHINLYTLFR